MSAAFDTFVERLERRLEQPLPGHAAHCTMAPSHRLDRALLSVERKTCREAGVLALLYPRGDVPTLVLTARPPSLRDHAGQVAFPGGRREVGESFAETALREAHEEIALDPVSVRLLGALTPLYIPPSRFCVYPFVGVCAAPPTLRPMEAEVARVLHVPLAHLLNPECRQTGQWTVRDELSEVPFYACDGLQVWGATAMMLAELLALVADVGV